MKKTKALAKGIKPPRRDEFRRCVIIDFIAKVVKFVGSWKGSRRQFSPNLLKWPFFRVSQDVPRGIGKVLGRLLIKIHVCRTSTYMPVSIVSHHECVFLANALTRIIIIEDRPNQLFIIAIVPCSYVQFNFPRD